MTTYLVRAMSVDPMNGAVTGLPRDEEVDTEANDLFIDSKTPWEVEDRYTHFWNRLNPSWEREFPRGKDKVVVLSVEEIA